MDAVAGDASDAVAGDPVDRLVRMRENYGLAGLTEAELAADWLTQFRHWFAGTVAAGLIEPNAMMLATATPDGVPSVRTVLLKGVDERGFTFFTHYTSPKGADLRANPRASLLFGWHALHRQVRVAGTAEPVSEAESDAYWVTRPWGSRIGAIASDQSTVIGSRAELEEAWAAAARRYPADGPVPRPATWGGFRIVPDAVEFWQGRPNRLHDRLRFRLDGGTWLVERLAP